MKTNQGQCQVKVRSSDLAKWLIGIWLIGLRAELNNWVKAKCSCGQSKPISDGEKVCSREQGRVWGGYHWWSRGCKDVFVKNYLNLWQSWFLTCESKKKLIAERKCNFWQTTATPAFDCFGFLTFVGLLLPLFDQHLLTGATRFLLLHQRWGLAVFVFWDFWLLDWGFGVFVGLHLSGWDLLTEESFLLMLLLLVAACWIWIFGFKILDF